MIPQFIHRPEYGNNIYSLDLKELITFDKKIKLLKSLNLKNKTYEEIRNLIYSICNEKKLLYFQHDLPEELFRGRVFKSLKDKPLEIEKMWYPPIDRVKNYGRVNKPNEQIFYGCSAFETVCAELNPNINEYLCVLVLKNTNTLKNYRILQLGYGKELLNKVNVKNIEDYLKLFNEQDEYYKSLITVNNIPVSVLTESYFLNNYYLEEFTKRVEKNHYYEYFTTVAVSEFWFNNPIIKGIIYPCIYKYKGKLKYVGPNYAIKANVIDEMYKFSNIAFYKKIKKVGINMLFEKICYSEELYDNKHIKWVFCN